MLNITGNFTIDQFNTNNDMYLRALRSADFLEITKLINMILTVIILFVGLIGNSLTIFVFIQQRYRVNSSNVYLLCLAVTDSLFLLIHLFEDTIRTYEGVYYKYSPNHIFFMNVTDNFSSACNLINYFRYFLRFTSAYIIVAFTLQRAYIVFFPLCDRFKSKRSAWYTVLFIVVVSSVLNSWVPFLFEIRKSDKYSPYCDVQKSWRNIYFIITIVYILLIMLIPMLVVFIFNTLIILRTKRSPLNRRSNTIRLEHVISTRAKPTIKRVRIVLPGESHNNLVAKSTFKSKTGSIISIRSEMNATKLMQSLVLISFSYAILNLPYLITWFLFFYQIAFVEINTLNRNYLFGSVQIAEIFYVLNYGIKFYIYCLSGTLFRNQLINSSN